MESIEVAKQISVDEVTKYNSSLLYKNIFVVWQLSVSYELEWPLSASNLHDVVSLVMVVSDARCFHTISENIVILQCKQQCYIILSLTVTHSTFQIENLV